MVSQKIFASPQDAEAAFYDALARCDVDAMMAVWADDEEIVCVHPGSPLLVGYALIREAWRQIFQRGGKLTVTVVHQTSVTTPFAMVSSVVENIASHDNESRHAPIAATNVFVRGPMGWRMVSHHASTAPQENTDEVPKILH